MCDSDPTVLSPESLLYKMPPFRPVSTCLSLFITYGQFKFSNTNNANDQLFLCDTKENKYAHQKCCTNFISHEGPDDAG